MATEQLEHIPTGDLIPYARNSRAHSDQQVTQLAASIHEFGFCAPILIDEASQIIAGHGRVMAAQKLKLETVPCRRLEHLSEAQKRAYVIADNRLAENATWDQELLTNELSDLYADDFDVELLGFEANELESLLGLEPDKAEIVEDEVPEPPADPVTQPGDLWRLGDHRLLCGDCRNVPDATKLLNGAEISVAFTSPPYASQRTYDEASGFSPVKPDEFVEWFEAVQDSVAKVLRDDGSWFVNIKEHCEQGQRSLYVKDLTLAHVRDWGWRFVDEICWQRPSLPASYPNRFKNAWEPVFHFAKAHEIKFRPQHVLLPFDSAGAKTSDEVKAAGRPHGFTSDGSNGGPGFVKSRANDGALPSNVLRVSGVERGVQHSAMFPTALPAFFIKAFTDSGDSVFDPFLGSGTTLIAAEQLNRKCYGMEISPQYCDVIIQRWEKLTGNKAKKE